MADDVPGKRFISFTLYQVKGCHHHGLFQRRVQQDSMCRRVYMHYCKWLHLSSFKLYWVAMAAYSFVFDSRLPK